MAVHQEEVKLRLGVDASQISAGMAGVSRTIGKFVDDTGKKLMSLARANIYMMAIDLARQIIPTAEEIWNAVYGVDPATTAKFQEANERLHKLRKELEATKKSLHEGLRDFFFDTADQRGKQEILFGEAKDAADSTRRAKQQLDYLKDHKAGIDAVAAAQSKYNEAFKAQLDAEKKLREFTDKMSTKDIGKQFDARRKQIVEQARKDRSDIAFNDALKASGQTPAFTDAQIQERKVRLADAVQAGQAAEMRRIAETMAFQQGDVGIASAYMEAAMRAQKDTIQKVHIIAVDE